MDCFSPYGLLLPSWLGKVMAALWRAVWIVPALGFPCLLCHPEPALYSWHFHPCPAPLPFLAAPSAQPGWELLGCHSQPARREQLRILAALCFWGSSCCRWGFARAAGLCPGPAVSVPAAPKQPPQSCGWQSCVALAVLYLVFRYYSDLTYPVAAVIRCIGNADVFITCCRCSFVGTLASNFQNFVGGGFLISFVDFFSKLEIKLWFLIELLQTRCFLKLNLLGFKLMEQETPNSDGLSELFQGADM